MTPLSEEDVARMREAHQPAELTSSKGIVVRVCRACAWWPGNPAIWPCDAYRLLEEREALKAELGRAFKGFSDIAAEIIRLDPEHESRIMQGDEAVTVAAWAVEWMRDKMARISELESAPKAEPSSIPLGPGFEERRAQEIAAIRRSEKLPDMSQRVGTPKAEASMTAEDFVRDLEADIHMLTGREAGRSPLITKAFIGAIRERDLSIAAAARKEAEDGMRAKFPLLSAKWLDPACREACRSLTIEHSRQALAEALRDLIDEEGDEPMVEHEHFNAPGIRCPRCLIVKALATHGQD